MFEQLITFLEGLGFTKVEAQLEYLLNPENIPFAIWETLYAPLAATVLAYLIGLPLGVLLVTGEEGGIHPLPKWLMRTLNTLINLLRSVPFLILMVLVMSLGSKRSSYFIPLQLSGMNTENLLGMKKNPLINDQKRHYTSAAFFAL